MRVFGPRRLLLAVLFVVLVPFAGGRVAAAPVADRAGLVESITPSLPAASPAPVNQQTTSDKLNVVRQAFDLLYTGFIQPLTAQQLLNDAWDGIARALTSAGTDAPARPSFTGDANADWATFAQAYHLLAVSGVASPSTIAYAAIGQMANARNSCHTAFLPPQASAVVNGSIAHQPTVDAGFVAGDTDNVIYRVYSGSPADRAGLHEGDTLLTSAGQGRPGIQRRIFLTSAGKPIVITVQRPGVADPVSLTLTPELTVLPFVRTHLIANGKIGVVQWDDFTEGAGQLEAVRQALQQFEAAGVVGWIMDVRTSPGGSANTGAALVNLFLANGIISTNVSRAGGRNVINTDPANAFSVQRPMVVLEEHLSASAAEFFAGALQDDRRAYVIGQTSYGCVSTSRIRTLLDGSLLQVEVERALIGNDVEDLAGVGVTPHESIIRTPEILASGVDPQMDRAIQYLLAATGQ